MKIAATNFCMLVSALAVAQLWQLVCSGSWSVLHPVILRMVSKGWTTADIGFFTCMELFADKGLSTYMGLCAYMASFRRIHLFTDIVCNTWMGFFYIFTTCIFVELTDSFHACVPAQLGGAVYVSAGTDLTMAACIVQSNGVPVPSDGASGGEHCPVQTDTAVKIVLWLAFAWQQCNSDLVEPLLNYSSC